MIVVDIHLAVAASVQALSSLYLCHPWQPHPAESPDDDVLPTNVSSDRVVSFQLRYRRALSL